MAEDNGNGKEPLGKKGISDLIALMEANNKSTRTIEVDGRNTRRHLLEIKKTQNEFVSLQKRVAFGFDNFSDVMQGNNLQEKEDSMDRATIFEEIRDAIKSLPQDTGKEVVKEDNKSGAGGKLGGILKGAGFAAAGLGIGIAAVFATAPKLIETFENMNVDKISDNVRKLVGINKQVEEDGGNLLLDGGSLALALGGIGIGLAAMSIGTGAAAAVDKFAGEDFASKIVTQVKTLLGIMDIPGIGMDAAGLTLTLTGLGLGLAAFGICKAADGVGSAISQFSSGDNFADNIKKEVETLLSIDLASAKDTAGLVATLGGLGLGLAAFAIGKAGAGVADAVTQFAGENFAADIKSEVETLLQIPQLPGVGLDTAAFVGVMGGLSAGLLAFAIGKSGSGVADALTRFTQGDNFAEDVKKEVETLLTIGEGASVERTKQASGALIELGAGLAAFASGKGLGALADLGEGIVSFFTGSKNPIDQAIELGDNAASVQAGADAFDEFAEALAKFSNVNIDFDAEEFAKELKQVSEILEASIVGGDVGGFIGIGETKFVGLKNLEDDIDQSIAVIKRLKDVLALESTGGNTMTAGGNTDGMVVQNLSAENAILRVADAGGGGGNAVITGGNTSSQTSNVVIQQQAPDNQTSSEQNVR